MPTNNPPNGESERRAGWLSPFVYFSNNWISRIGVVLVTTATIFWLFLLPITLRGEVSHPYAGILIYLILPGVFFAGLALIPAGLWLRWREARRGGTLPAEFPAVTFRNPEFRRLLTFVGVVTFVNLIVAGQVSYAAINYMDTVSFCGQTCHTVMKPEFTAYQNSPHSRVECVACHIGPGASWFVRSKLSGLRQVFAVTFKTYSKPIPTPVRNLRPARETCEQCHWPQQYGGQRLRVVPKYADDEQNSLTRTVLLMRIGGGNQATPTIHGAHLGPGIRIEYLHTDEGRQNIPQVEYFDAKTGRKTVFTAADAKPQALQNATRRVMDCMDCHNRPTHTYQLPEREMDNAMAAGRISPSLPFVKKEGIEILKRKFATNEEAANAIPRALEAYYQKAQPAVYAQRRPDIVHAGQVLAAIYNRNVFPEMNVQWGSYPNNLGHTDFPGCYRCHDDNHAAADGRKVTQDCNTCHRLLAMDEANPKILQDLSYE